MNIYHISGELIKKIPYDTLNWVNLHGARLNGANFTGASLHKANLSGAYLRGAYLSSANLSGANLAGADLTGAVLKNADLSWADLSGADLRNADLTNTSLFRANLAGANLLETILTGATLYEADLSKVYGLVKRMGVVYGNIYWKRVNSHLVARDYVYRVGMNKLQKGDVFNADERITCACPGLHFASRSWCATYFPKRPVELKVRIPARAIINEPWTTDGKASASSLEVLAVYDAATGRDITERYRGNKTDGRGKQVK